MKTRWYLFAVALGVGLSLAVGFSLSSGKAAGPAI